MEDQYKHNLIKGIRENGYEIIEDLNHFDFKRTDLGVQQQFNEVLIYLNTIKRIIEELLSLQLTEVSPSQLEQVTQQVGIIKGCLINVKNFTIDPLRDFLSDRKQIIKGLEDNLSGFINTITPVLFVYGNRETRALQTSERISRLLTEAERDVTQIKKTVEVIQDTAGKVGVKEYSDFFRMQANEHDRKAINWLIVSIALGFSLIAFLGVSLLYLNPEKYSQNNYINLLVNKVVIASILYYGLTFSIKNYRSNQHNYIVNKHRQNSLNCFETFIKAAEGDNQTKQAILLRTTEAIFNSQASGYSNIEPENESSKIIEVFRNIGAK